MIIPDQKIKVFISSKCGEKKYDRVRLELKDMIEATQLAEVYLFENKEASTSTAEDHYVWSLEDSDVCVFLIDNNDGIPKGVQKEIDTARRLEIKALYYFCDEKSQEKTPLEQSLIGAKFSKTKTVHSFEDFSKNSAQGIIDDIIFVYHNYCKGRLIRREEDSNQTHFRDFDGDVDVGNTDIPKFVLREIDKTKNYILRFIFGSHLWEESEEDKSSDIDEWGECFLQVMLEGKPIQQFNTGLFNDALKGLQSSEFNKVVRYRWEAIQFYYLNNVENCISSMKVALDYAKESNQPAWVINDILIDLRNLHLKKCKLDNCYTESEAQKELSQSEESVYYPVLDRIHENLHEKYTKAHIKDKTASPYSITIGNDLNEYGELLACSLLVPMMNGSLTHILLFPDLIREFLFCQCSNYNDWSLKRGLLKFTLFSGKEKDVQGVIRVYPEVVNNLNDKDAADIMGFCQCHPLKQEKLAYQLRALGTVGYYLNDTDFARYQDILIRTIKDWFQDKNAIVDFGLDFLRCLNAISYRLPQEILSDICCLYMEHQYRRWYSDLFKFMEMHIDLQRMDRENATRLIQNVIDVMGDREGLKQISYVPSFLASFRLQNRELTNKLDKRIQECLPEYYEQRYKLETLENEDDYPEHIKELVRRVHNNNERQGKNGTYYAYGTRDIAVIRELICQMTCEKDLDIDSVVSTAAETLLLSKEEINTKLDAVDLLICIVQKYPDAYERNKAVFDDILKNEDSIGDEERFFFSNIDRLALRIGLQMLFTAMGKNTYLKLMELLSYIRDNTMTIISVSELIAHYLQPKGEPTALPERIEQLILQNTLQWIQCTHINARINAVKILFELINKKYNKRVINQQIVRMIDSDSPQIKALILRKMDATEGVDEKTKNYIKSKCKYDSNYYVRMICYGRSS